MSAPILSRYEGEGRWAPASAYWAKKADEEHVVGQVYALAEVQERSSASHAHYFAALNQMWGSLPDDKAMEFPTMDALRKRALIMTGYRSERRLVASSNGEARKIAAFLQPRDTHVLVSVAGHVVVEWTAQSQSMRAMGKAVFQESKDAVLNWVADLLGLAPEDRRYGLAPERRAA